MSITKSMWTHTRHVRRNNVHRNMVRQGARGLLTCAAVVGALLPGGCGTFTIDGEVKSPAGEIHYRVTPSKIHVSLPSGWTITGQESHTIIKDGRRFTKIVCVASNPSEPNCIYTNDAGCNSPNTWIQVCKDLATPEGFPPGGDPEVQTCQVESASIEYSEAFHALTITHTTCMDITLRRPLGVHAQVAAPGENFMSWSDYSEIHGNTIPSGMVIRLTGHVPEVVLDAAIVGLKTISFTSAGSVVDAGISHIDGLPPMAIIAQDGVIRQSMMIVSNPSVADWNLSGEATVQDIFDYLTVWFGGSIAADINGSGSVTVQDIFDYLGRWFAGY